VSTEKSPDHFKPHAIQLKSLRIIELYLKVKANQDPSVIPEADSFTLYFGHGRYDEENRTIIVHVRAEVGQDDGTAPYELRVELAGAFEVDPDKFPIIHIEDWAKRNAPLILYPYLREHVYGLTSRAEVGAILLPLFEIPTFKVFYNENN
jgi:preprotein translocase subunit SecB